MWASRNDEATAAEWRSVQLVKSVLQADKNLWDAGWRKEATKTTSRQQRLSAGAIAWKRNSADLISGSQISKAWSQPISAFPQTWKRFFFFFYDLSGKAGMVTKLKGAAHILKKNKKKTVIPDFSQITHKAQPHTSTALPGCTNTDSLV